MDSNHQYETQSEQQYQTYLLAQLCGRLCGVGHISRSTLLKGYVAERKAEVITSAY